MQDLFRFADELGPARIIHIHRASVGLRAILVVDNAACGATVGGIRMAPDVSVDECFRLARAMTWKKNCCRSAAWRRQVGHLRRPAHAGGAEGADHPRLCRRDPRHRRLHPRSRHGYR